MPCLLLLLSCLRSLELFFATNQNNRTSSSGDHPNDKSPRLCRKFSSPPPLSIPSRTSSPVRTRKLSLNSPLNSKVGILDLSSNPTSFSAASSPTSANPTTSPPPSTNPRSPLELNRGQSPSSPEQSPGAQDENADSPRIDAFCGKLRRSIRRGKIIEGHPEMTMMMVLIMIIIITRCLSLRKNKVWWPGVWRHQRSFDSHRGFWFSEQPSTTESQRGYELAFLTSHLWLRLAQCVSAFMGWLFFI